MELLIGTANSFKIKESHWFLEGLPQLSIHPLSEISDIPEIEEDGETLVENSNKKASILSTLTPHIVLTSDAGVAIPGLGKNWDYRRPKRNVGENSTAEERMNKLLSMMSGLSGEQRRVEYTMALSLAQNGQILWSKEFFGYSGYIVDEIKYVPDKNDRWMGSLWYLPEFKRVEVKLNPEQLEKLRDQQLPVREELHEYLLGIENS